MADSIATRRKFGIAGVLAAMALLLTLISMSAAPASASLCIIPNDGPGKSDTPGDYVAEAPPSPEDFEDRGRSMSNPAGKLAAWEAHFNSPVVDGPQSCEDMFE